jgi:hypothetical protein
MLPVIHGFWLGKCTYGHFGDDVIDALIDEAGDYGVILLNSIA